MTLALFDAKPMFIGSHGKDPRNSLFVYDSNSIALFMNINSHPYRAIKSDFANLRLLCYLFHVDLLRRDSHWHDVIVRA